MAFSTIKQALEATVQEFNSWCKENKSYLTYTRFSELKGVFYNKLLNNLKLLPALEYLPKRAYSVSFINEFKVHEGTLVYLDFIKFRYKRDYGYYPDIDALLDELNISCKELNLTLEETLA